MVAKGIVLTTLALITLAPAGLSLQGHKTTSPVRSQVAAKTSPTNRLIAQLKKQPVKTSSFRITWSVEAKTIFVTPLKRGDKPNKEAVVWLKKYGVNQKEQERLVAASRLYFDAYCPD